MGSLDFSTATGAAILESQTVIVSTNNYTPISIIAWAKRTNDGIAENHSLVSFTDPTYVQGHSFNLESTLSSNRIRITARDQSLSYRTGFGSGFINNAWNSIISVTATDQASAVPPSRAAWSNGDTGIASESNITFSTSLTVLAINAQFGAWPGSLFDGKLAHIAIFAGALTLEQRAAFNSGSNAFEVEAVVGGTATLAAYYPGTIINDGVDKIEDVSGNAHHIPVGTSGIVYDSVDEPTVNALPSVELDLQLQPLYLGGTVLANKTNIEWKLYSGDTLDGDVIGYGTDGTTDEFGVFQFPNPAPVLGVVNDLVTLTLYWLEGTEPVVDRSLIVKTTLVAA